MGRLRGCIILLLGISGPWILNHARAVLFGDLHCTVAGMAVDHHDLIATAQAFDRARDVALLVVGDDGGRDLHQNSSPVRMGSGENERIRITNASSPSFQRL